MKIRFYFILIYLAFFTCVNQGLAQKSIHSTSGEAIGTNGKVSYSIGQVFYQSTTSTTARLNEGVQQPYTISIKLGEEIESIQLSITAFPNPATDYFTINIEEGDLAGFKYSIFDLKGALLQSSTIVSNQTVVPISSFSQSFFIVNIIQNGKVIKQFKIIKNR